MKLLKPLLLYLQLEDELRRRIEAGEFSPDSPIPSEHRLEVMYGVSRITVREAISRLVSVGYLRKERGKGTFVQALRKIDERIGRVTSFTEEIIARGLKPGTKVLSAIVRAAPDRIAKMLQIDTGAPVFCLERLRYVDDDPVAVSKDFVVPALAPGIEAVSSFGAGSFYQLLEREYGFEMAEAAEEVEATLPLESQARLLGISQTAPVLMVHRVVHGRVPRAPDGPGPIEALVTIFRGDRFKYCAPLAGRSEEKGERAHGD
jgi:GntR family transcriptional regulator